MKKYSAFVMSEGISTGNAVVLNYNNLSFSAQKGIAEEKNKLSLAINNALLELSNLVLKDSRQIAEIHKMILSDEVLKAELFYEIEYNGASAVNACNVVFDKYVNEIKESPSAYLKERYLDILDVKKRLLNNLSQGKITTNINDNFILVIEELFPSLILDSKDKLRGVICKVGGYTSHAAILCRALGIPCVVVSDFNIHTNDKVIIDTSKNLVILNPTEVEIKRYKEASYFDDDKSYMIGHQGYRFLCNVSSNYEIKKCFDYDFDGIGLYRTEFIFMSSNHILNVDEQQAIYQEAATLMKDKTICFRTYDISDDKKFDYIDSSAEGVCNYYLNPLVFETQIKALVMANKYNNIKIMFPMIREVSDFIKLKKWVLNIKSKLNNNSKIEIGMVLETKEALTNIKEFSMVDFITIGSNDLTKELYNIARNTNVDYAVFLDDLLKKLTTVVDFCSINNIPLSICGELAAIEEITKKLINIKITDFSVNTPNIKHLYLAINDLKK